MEIRKLSREQIQTVYHAYMVHDFDRNELRPLFSLLAGFDRGEYDCFGLYDEEKLCAYAYFVRLPSEEGGNICLFDYLAVIPAQRGQGIGSRFLQALPAHLPDARLIVGEMEDPDVPCSGDERAIREKRRHFYLKNGFLDTGVRSLVFGVDYALFEVPTGPSHSHDEIKKAYTSLYRSILAPLFFQTQFYLKDLSLDKKE